MASAIRLHRRVPHRSNARASERIPLSARLSVTTLDGKPVAPLSRCTNIGMGGLRGCAALGLRPGTPVHFVVELPSGCVFRGCGRIAWCRTTLHPELFGSPRGMDDDAVFGIAFEHFTPEDMLPVARLLVARQDQRRRARRIRRLHGISNHA